MELKESWSCGSEMKARRSFTPRMTSRSVDLLLERAIALHSAPFETGALADALHAPLGPQVLGEAAGKVDDLARCIQRDDGQCLAGELVDGNPALPCE
eukprot:CAMPEP_0171262628 /NCGR_PEP_ID=MMETSP0790-20130122/56662_1 /TAXON_ID=2925 /ORGANISM="Alexandrium catenella, Strain OF101" /LENGTH=97 /DNA_ID=CAMNT_0011731181 /DNA_START=147 /DNA_END=440 /DNA_ORIENTATION=+